MLVDFQLGSSVTFFVPLKRVGLPWKVVKPHPKAIEGVVNHF
jgi:hypothetical protein